MDAPTSTGIPTQPEPLKPWKQVAEENNIFSLPAEQRVAEYDKWSAKAIEQGIRDGDFDSPDTFGQFKALDIRTRKNLASDDIVGASDEDVINDLKAYNSAFTKTRQAFALQKPTPEDNAIQGEVLQGKRNAAFVRGQMVFNPTIVNDPQKYRQAILESDAPPDIKALYAGMRPEMEKSATITRRRELANSVITRDVADKVVNAIQEGTEIFGADIGTPQSPALKKNKEGVWSVVDPEYSDKETSFLGRANAKYNPLADSLYKPLAAINEYQKKYGLSDEQVQQDYMEALIENAPTAVNRWVSKATSVEEYVKQLDSTVRVKNRDVAPEVRVQNPNLFFDEEGYNAAVDKANAPEEAKVLAKEARTQFADAVAGDIYNNLLANRDDFREIYAKNVVDKKDISKAITQYYKDKRDQAWYDDIGEFAGQTGTALGQGLMNAAMTPSAILGMFGSVKDAEDVRYATMVQSGQMQAEEAVAGQTGGAGAIKLTGDFARILPDLAVQMVIGIMSGGALSFSQAAALSARTGLTKAAARTAIRQAMLTGEKAALKTELVKLIPNLTAQSIDDVATGALEIAAKTMSNNPLKGGIGTQKAIGSAYAGLTSAGSTFAQVYTDVRNMGKSPEESIGIARTAGITAGAITGALTHTFGVLGRGGVEDFASMGRKAGEFTIRDIMKSGVYDVLTTQEGRQLARSIATGIAKDALHEGVEEGLDQALNLISQYATNPSPEAQNRKVSDIINESLYATLLGGMAGGMAGGVGQLRAKAPGITAQQMQAEIIGVNASQAGAPAQAVPQAAPQPAAAPQAAPVAPQAPIVPPAPAVQPTPTGQSANPAAQQAAATAQNIANTPGASQTAAALAGLANAAAAPIIPPPINLPVVSGQQQPFQQTAQPPVQPPVQPQAAPVAAPGQATAQPQAQGISFADIDFVNVPILDKTTGKLNPVSGASKIVDLSGRRIVMVDVNGVVIPFYVSTGLGGKKAVKSGKWYPFFGLTPDGWINKLDEKTINSYYGSQTLRNIAEQLDRDLGPNPGPYQRVGPKSSQASINRGLTALGLAASDDPKKVELNVKKIVSIIENTQTAQPQVAAALVAPAVAPPANTTPEEEADYRFIKLAVISSQNANIRFLQQRFRMGYGRAQAALERMEKEGIIGPNDGKGSHPVLVAASTQPTQPTTVEPETTENIKPKTTELSDDAAEAMRDIIQMKKSKGEKPSDDMVSRLAEYDAKKSGVQIEQGDVVSNIVVGHPMFEPPQPELSNLIPIKIKSKDQVSGSIDRALKLKAKALEYIGGYQYNQSTAKTPAQKKQFAEKFNKQELSRQEEILRYLNEDVFPELERIEKLAPESQPATVEPTAGQPTEEMKTTEETPTARDATKPEQMTPEEYAADNFAIAKQRFLQSRGAAEGRPVSVIQPEYDQARADEEAAGEAVRPYSSYWWLCQICHYAHSSACGRRHPF